jgi:hypothetical protein
MPKPIENLVADSVERWQDVQPPHPASIASAKALGEVIASFEKLRGQLVFEDEPSSFEAALQETKERTP